VRTCDVVEARTLVGVVVSRAVGSAVVRTTVKRRLRGVARSRVAHVPEGTLLVIRANPAAAGATSAVLAEDLDAALRRLRKGSEQRGGGR
jgi:ribonuclease P protein component